MTNILFWVGGTSIFWLTAIVIWSILVPKHRIWPIGKLTLVKAVLIWGPFIAMFISVFGLGVLDWNNFGWHKYLRWGIGLPLILIGHLVVYVCAIRLGFRQVSGAKGELKIDGLFRYSRNPQYMADMGIMIGWVVLSASLNAMLLALPVVAILFLAPFSEEPWLRTIYGKPYTDYCKRVRRFL